MLSDVSPRLLIGRAGISTLIVRLRESGFEVMGPTVRDGALDYDEVDDVSDLPVGWSDVQAPGSFRLEKRTDNAVFQFASTAQSWKRLLHPPVQPLLTVDRTESGIRFVPQPAEKRRRAFLGARACDLRAMGLLERALTEDPAVRARRAQAFIVAVDCGRSASTCFCTSMGTGPPGRAR